MTSLEILLVAGGVGLASLVGTGLALRAAVRRDLVAHPNERSSHSEPTPSGGGIALGIAATIGFLACMSSIGTDDGVWWLGATAAAVAATTLVGWRDDVRAFSPRTKALLVLAAVIVLVIRQPLDGIELPYFGFLPFGVLALPLFAFWLWGFANAFNFMDGLNGIAGLTALVSGAAFAVAGHRADDLILLALGAVTAATAAGFLPWNLPRARIFMGDAGSLPLGLLLATCGLRGAASGALPFPAAVLVLGPFVFDTTFTLARRGLRGAPVWQAHREHLYQRLSRRWGGHASVSLLYAGLSVVTGVLGLAYGSQGPPGRVLSLVLPLCAMLGFAVLVLRSDRAEGEGAGDRRPDTG